MSGPPFHAPCGAVCHGNFAAARAESSWPDLPATEEERKNAKEERKKAKEEAKKAKEEAKKEREQ
eukprot:gene4893-4399_t